MEKEKIISEVRRIRNQFPEKNGNQIAKMIGITRGQLCKAIENVRWNDFLDSNNVLTVDSNIEKNNISIRALIEYFRQDSRLTVEDVQALLNKRNIAVVFEGKEITVLEAIEKLKEIAENKKNSQTLEMLGGILKRAKTHSLDGTER